MQLNLKGMQLSLWMVNNFDFANETTLSKFLDTYSDKNFMIHCICVLTFRRGERKQGEFQSQPLYWVNVAEIQILNPQMLGIGLLIATCLI